ncbi:acetoin utilization protein AcuC [Paenibacillus sp. GCM10012307]|uniref:Acetoin utilization protein AcuC n=1 Tax=Paenibacillus roseus TaxID=2798579 RepID=A0A934MSH1_9BACL|nr:acetoin utilization protein AcuC [Paenibacillus roseus]MBJ6363264.1 acetoin utilization protein AcuC [Paenibacillus roseus]
MPANAVLVHNPEALHYQFYEEHPFNPLRLTLTLDLLRKCGALEQRQIIRPSAAKLEELLRVHRKDYVETISRLSENPPADHWVALAGRYGLDFEDTPYFPGMHHVSSIIAGGSLCAAETVMSGQSLHAFHMAGGLHHAFPERGSGFCVYNDTAVAIAHVREKYHARVLYIDTDVHHGDGVQWIFYNDPDVCTYSIHETGKFLFPGTGFVYEKGSGEGFGASFNVPMEPYTEDESWIESFTDTIEKVTAAFKPDIIISQHGCDAHALDPLSHIHCSMNIYREMPKIIHRLAHQYAGGRWVAVGGGGYDIWQVVPRAWSLVWLEMSDHALATAIGPHSRLPEDWVQHWSQQHDEELPETWLDDMALWKPMPRRAEIRQKNKEIARIAVQDL